MQSGVITGLFHIAIKTDKLEKTLAFYCEVLGLVESPRPDFGYPGAWLAVPTPSGPAVIHIYAGGPALGTDGKAPSGSAAVDHVSLTAVGYHDFIRRFRQSGIEWREFLVPGTTLWQLFVYDPSGVQLELTFDGRVEELPSPDMSEQRRYRAGESFFDKASS